MPGGYRNDLTADEVRGLLDYDPETGLFRWRKPGKGRISCHRRFTGYVNKKGYVIIGIKYRPYLAHRLAWLWMTGDWPRGQLDHKDRNRSNNKWHNLREATSSEQNLNSNSHPYLGLTCTGIKQYAGLE